MKPETTKLARALIRASLSARMLRSQIGDRTESIALVIDGYQQGLIRAIGVICEEQGETCTDAELEQLEDEVRREMVP